MPEPLPTIDGGTLRTLEDACRYMLALSKQRELGAAWQQAAKLILNRADAEAITHQLSLALFMDAKLDLGHKRARTKTPA